MTRHTLRSIVAFVILTSTCGAADEPAELRNAKFSAIYSAAGQLPFDRANSVGDFTIKGPVRDTLTPLPKGMVRVAYDPDQKIYYALSHHSVFELNLADATATEMKPEFKGDREFSWACGITFDTKRKRLLVVSLGGTGYFYSYSPAEKKWTVIADASNIDYSAIGYSESNDTVFAIHQGYTDQAGPTLSQLNSAGAVVKTTKLKNRQLAASIGHGPVRSITQLIPLKEHLVLIVSPEYRGDRDQDMKTQMYVVNLKDNSVIEAWSE